MGRIGVSIVKSTTFRGAAQEFANTYYYEFTGTPNSTLADELISLIVSIERPMHATSVTFVRARAWSAGGSPATNEQLAQTALSGAGTGGTPLGKMDKERAFLVRFRAGSDTKGRPVYLRKWWHLDAAIVGGVAISDGVLQNTTALTTPQRSAIEGWGNSIKDLVPTSLGGGHCTLVSENGREISGATTAHPYLEHHQLGDMWR